MEKKQARKSLKNVRVKIKDLNRELRIHLRREKKLLKVCKKMKPGRGAAKGKAFERVVAKMIVRRFSKFGITSEDCYRTPLSGGHIYAKKEDPSDIVLSPKLQKLLKPFTGIECKDQKCLQLWRFFISFDKHQKSWPEYQFLNQVLKAVSTKKGVEPVLVFKTDSQIFCAIRDDENLYFKDKLNGPMLTFNFGEDRTWTLALFKDILRMLLKRAIVRKANEEKGKK